MSICPHCAKSDRAPRSGPDHRRLFSIIAAAYDNWPSTHPFQPSDLEHFRAWLLIKAGYCETRTVDITGDVVAGVQNAARIAKALAAHGLLKVRDDQIDVVVPKSMRFDKMSQREFGPVRQAIEDILCSELGVTVRALEKADAA